VSIMTAVVLALVLTGFWYWWYLYFLMPTFAGLILGFAISRVVATQSVRSRPAVILTAILGACVLMGVFRYADYIVDREWTVNSVIAEDATFTRGEVRQLMDEFIVEEVGLGGFLGYTHWIAVEGLGQDEDEYGSTQFTESAFGTYGYWGLEVAIVAVLAIMIGAARASMPFCLISNTWLDWRSAGFIERKNWGACKAAINRGNYAALSQYLTQKGKFEIQVAGCADHPSDVALRVYKHEGRFSAAAIRPRVVTRSDLDSLFKPMA
jgi:hypothetical protein